MEELLVAVLTALFGLHLFELGLLFRLTGSVNRLSGRFDELERAASSPRPLAGSIEHPGGC